MELSILEDIGRTGEPADRALRRAFRRHRSLTNEDRKRIARRVHGVRCFLLRLDHLLSHAGRPTDDAHRLEAYRIDVEGEPDTLGLGGARWPDDPIDALSVRRSIPRWVAELWSRRSDADALAAALNVPGPIVVRVRDAARFDLPSTPRKLAPNARCLTGRPDIRGSAAWRAGAFEVQDEGSQLIACAVGARPGERVLDLCAGAGGKTLAIADDMQDDGEVVAHDVDDDRLHDLSVRLGRTGHRSIRIQRVPKGSFDRVLVDAPCSALGTWRRGPDRKWHVEPEDVARHATLQLDLLVQASRFLRPGGRVVYATCTLTEEENQNVVSRALQHCPALEPAPVLEALLPGLSDDRPGQLELLPHAHDTDAFFVAAFRMTDRNRPA